MEPSSIKIKAPGRICLFGDHQDYLGLPVIACAINRYLNLEAHPIDRDEFRIALPDLDTSRVISLEDKFDILNPGDFYGSSLRLLRGKGVIPTQGYQIEIRSKIPINAGTSSSSALTVAWIHFLLSSITGAPEPTPERLAEWAYQAEVVEHQSPGGKMDQYTIAIGDLIHINTRATLGYQKLGSNVPGLVLAESGIPKSTIGVLGDLRGKAQDSIALVSAQDPQFELEQTTIAQLPGLLKLLPPEKQPYFEAAIRNHCITKEAHDAFRQPSFDIAHIGKLMYAHHEVLRDLLGLTVPRIDRIIDEAMQAGAYGTKIVGSGGGGSVVALAPIDKQEMVVQAMLDQQAVAAYKVEVGPGSKISI